jgi:hypothetical protein
MAHLCLNAIEEVTEFTRSQKLSKPENTKMHNLYSELGVELQSTVAEIGARIEEERERSNRLKKIPRRRPEAESRLAQLAEIERVLLDSSARAAYDSWLQSGETSAKDPLPTSVPWARPAHELSHFCVSCGAALPDGASFCEECGKPFIENDARHSDVFDRPTEILPIAGDELAQEVSGKPPSEVVKPHPPILSPDPPPSSPSQIRTGPSPAVFLIPILLLAGVVAIWFFNQRPAQPVTAPAVSGQVTDLRPPQVSLLNHPTIQPSPVASWDTQNIHGSVTIKSENDQLSIVYPNGSQYSLDAKLLSTTTAGSAAFSEEYGTVMMESSATPNQKTASSWQLQFQAEQAKDINGDGFPELVLSNFSGGAHCCTTVAVISLRPQGPFVVFDEELGSGGAIFKDIDGDGRREIRYDHLFEYALGTFAQGTFSTPVIYSAGKDGVYRVNTRAFAQLMSNEYESAAEEHQKAAYDPQTGAMEEDRDLINMFFRAYLGGRSTEGFEALTRLKPIVNENSSILDPRVTLEEALQKVAPEVLQQTEWAHIKSGQLLAPVEAAPVGQQGTVPTVPTPSQQEQQPSTFTPPKGDGYIPGYQKPSAAFRTQPAPVPASAPALVTSGVLHYHGPPIHLGERVAFPNLPGARLRFTFDHQSWQALIAHQPDGTQTLTLRSLKQDVQTQCDIGWEIIK